MEMVRLEPPAELTMSVGETMFTQRATRRLDPNRPVTDAQREIILFAFALAPLYNFIAYALVVFYNLISNLKNRILKKTKTCDRDT